MKYTLYYQPPASGRKIAVVTSDSLLKLCKIKYMTFTAYKREGFPFIAETGQQNNENSFCYGPWCLFDYERDEFIRFMVNVSAGRYCKTYDYSQRVRSLTIQEV